MIKIVILGLVCVGGVGAIAAATSKSAPVSTPSVVYPSVAGIKADRLTLVSIPDTQPTVKQVTVPQTSSSEPQLPVQAIPRDVVKTQPPEIISRHWHDPYDTRASAKKLKPEPSRSTSRNGASAKVAQSQDCQTDGVSSLMRKLSLQPACSR